MCSCALALPGHDGVGPSTPTPTPATPNPHPPRRALAHTPPAPYRTPISPSRSASTILRITISICRTGFLPGRLGSPLDRNANQPSLFHQHLVPLALPTAMATSHDARAATHPAQGGQGTQAAGIAVDAQRPSAQFRPELTRHDSHGAASRLAPHWLPERAVGRLAFSAMVLFVASRPPPAHKADARLSYTSSRAETRNRGLTRTGRHDFRPLGSLRSGIGSVPG